MQTCVGHPPPPSSPRLQSFPRLLLLLHACRLPSLTPEIATTRKEYRRVQQASQHTPLAIPIASLSFVFAGSKLRSTPASDPDYFTVLRDCSALHDRKSATYPPSTLSRPVERDVLESIVSTSHPLTPFQGSGVLCLWCFAPRVSEATHHFVSVRSIHLYGYLVTTHKDFSAATTAYVQYTKGASCRGLLLRYELFVYTVGRRHTHVGREVCELSDRPRADGGFGTRLSMEE